MENVCSTKNYFFGGGARWVPSIHGIFDWLTDGIVNEVCRVKLLMLQTLDFKFNVNLSGVLRRRRKVKEEYQHGMKSELVRR